MIVAGVTISPVYIVYRCMTDICIQRIMILLCRRKGVMGTRWLVAPARGGKKKNSKLKRDTHHISAITITPPGGSKPPPARRLSPSIYLSRLQWLGSASNSVFIHSAPLKALYLDSVDSDDLRVPRRLQQILLHVQVHHAEAFRRAGEGERYHLVDTIVHRPVELLRLVGGVHQHKLVLHNCIGG